MTQLIVTYQGQVQPACSLRPWAKKFAETATKNVNMQKLLSNIISNDYYTFQELMEPRAGCLSQSFVLNVFIEDSSSSNDIFWNRFRQVSIFEETRFFPFQNKDFYIQKAFTNTYTSEMKFQISHTHFWELYHHCRG